MFLSCFFLQTKLNWSFIIPIILEEAEKQQRLRSAARNTLSFHICTRLPCLSPLPTSRLTAGVMRKLGHSEINGLSKMNQLASGRAGNWTLSNWLQILQILLIYLNKTKVVFYVLLTFSYVFVLKYWVGPKVHSCFSEDVTAAPEWTFGPTQFSQPHLFHNLITL